MEKWRRCCFGSIHREVKIAILDEVLKHTIPGQSVSQLNACNHGGLTMPTGLAKVVGTAEVSWAESPRVLLLAPGDTVEVNQPAAVQSPSHPQENRPLCAEVTAW